MSFGPTVTALDETTLTSDTLLVCSKSSARNEITIGDVILYLLGDGLSADNLGFRCSPINSQSGNYTCVANDAARAILHPSGAGAGDTYTIPSNASVPYEIGTTIVFINRDSNSLSINITSDTLILAGGTSTGARTLAENGLATAVKVESTVWLISGAGLT